MNGLRKNLGRAKLDAKFLLKRLAVRLPSLPTTSLSSIILIVFLHLLCLGCTASSIPCQVSGLALSLSSFAYISQFILACLSFRQRRLSNLATKICLRHPGTGPRNTIKQLP